MIDNNPVTFESLEHAELIRNILAFLRLLAFLEYVNSCPVLVLMGYLMSPQKSA
jgi:hypothetical protein